MQINSVNGQQHSRQVPKLKLCMKSSLLFFMLQLAWTFFSPLPRASVANKFGVKRQATPHHSWKWLIPVALSAFDIFFRCYLCHLSYRFGSDDPRRQISRSPRFTHLLFSLQPSAARTLLQNFALILRIIATFSWWFVFRLVVARPTARHDRHFPALFIPSTLNHLSSLRCSGGREREGRNLTKFPRSL